MAKDGELGSASEGGSGPGRRIDPFCGFAVGPLLATAALMLITGNPWWTTLWFAFPAAAVLVFDVWSHTGAAAMPCGPAGSAARPTAAPAVRVAQLRTTRMRLAQTTTVMPVTVTQPQVMPTWVTPTGSEQSRPSGHRASSDGQIMAPPRPTRPHAVPPTGRAPRRRR